MPLCIVLAEALTASSLGHANPRVTLAKKKSPAITTAAAAGTTTVNEQLLSLTPACAKSKTLVGGGFSSSLPTSPSSPDLHIVYESRRLSRSKWIVSATRLDADMSGNPLELVAYARCRATEKVSRKHGGRKRKDALAAKKGKKKPQVQTAEASVPLLPGILNSATTTANCPGRTKALSGGFALSPAPLTGMGPLDVASLFQSRRSRARGWAASATHFSLIQRTLTAFAYCIAGKAPKQRSSTAFLAGTPLSTAAVDPPRCPARLKLASGGFLAQVPSETGGAGMFLTSAPSGKSWRSLAVQSGDGTGGPVSGFSYCL